MWLLVLHLCSPVTSHYFHVSFLLKTTAAVLPERLLCAFHLLKGFQHSVLKSPTGGKLV